MLEFNSAVITAEQEAEDEARIKALMEGTRHPEDEARIQMLMQGDEPLTRKQAVAKAEVTEWLVEPMSREDAEAEVYEDPYTDFELDGRTMRAYQPTSGQLAFMMASLGRGQSDAARFSAILNIMFECLRAADKDYLEGRMLTRNRRERLEFKTLERIFEGLTKEWFARPTK